MMCGTNLIYLQVYLIVIANLTNKLLLTILFQEFRYIFSLQSIFEIITFLFLLNISELK